MPILCEQRLLHVTYPDARMRNEMARMTERQMDGKKDGRKDGRKEETATTISLIG